VNFCFDIHENPPRITNSNILYDNDEKKFIITFADTIDLDESDFHSVNFITQLFEEHEIPILQRNADRETYENVLFNTFVDKLFLFQEKVKERVKNKTTPETQVIYLNKGPVIILGNKSKLGKYI